jgi:hypothetical protein
MKYGFPTKIIDNKSGKSLLPVRQQNLKTGDILPYAEPLQAGYSPVYDIDNAMKSGNYTIRKFRNNRNCIIMQRA